MLITWAVLILFANMAHAVPATSMDTVFEQRTGNNNDVVYVANPDQDSVTAVNATSGARLAIIPVGDEPRSMALDGRGNLWVVNKGNATISIIDTQSRTVVNTLTGAYGSRPHGIVIDTNANRAYVVMENLGQVWQLDTITTNLINTASVGSHPREVSINNDGSRIYLPRFITAPISGESGTNPAAGGGEIVVLNTADLSSRASIDIRYNLSPTSTDSNVNARGVPNYLRALAMSPAFFNHAILPAKIDNIHRGSRRDGRSRQFNVFTRGIASAIDLDNNVEQYTERFEFRDNSQPSAAAISPDGLLVYFVHEGSREFGIYPSDGGAPFYRTTLQYAPTGLVVSPDGRRVYVHNWLSRSLSIIDTSNVTSTGGPASVITHVSLTDSEALNATVLNGKRLFHDSADPRMAGQRYISCASCHDEAGHDGRVWDFSDVGEGLRNTADMRGRGNMEDGLVHWTANFDEIQDFESATRELFGGTGLMTDADFNATYTPIDPNAMKTGRSSDLDSIAAYVDTLDTHGVSPYRQSNGALTAQGTRGQQVFDNAGCAACHSGVDFTDSPLGGSHNIGSIDANTGGRFGQPLINGGLDTPTLKGLWDDAPYLHNGSALNIRQAIQAHTQNTPVATSSLSSGELDDLAAYVLQIDDNEPAPQAPDTGTSNPDVFSTFANIAIDGTMNDWGNEAILTSDPLDATGGANQLDYQTVWMANDNQNLYIRYRNHQPNNARLTWGYGQALDVDGLNSGYRPAGNRIPIAADFIIEEQSLYRYTGNGTSWSWAWVATLPIQFNGRNAELSVNRSMLGNPDSFDLFFYTDNAAIGGTAVDFIPDSVTNSSLPLYERYYVYEFDGDYTAPPVDPPAGGDRIIYSNQVTPLNIDGSSSDWIAQGVSFFPVDPDDIAGTSNTFDFLQAGVAHDNSNLYVGWNNDGPMQQSWGYAVYIDTDLDRDTGFVGFSNDAPVGIDYLLEDNSVYRYSGNGFSWQWTWVNAFPVAVAGNSIEMQVPLNNLGNPTTMDLFFYGDSSAVGGTGIDFYPDNAADTNAAAETRTFRYSR